MRPKLWEDTAPAAEAALVEGYRRMSPARKAHQINQLTVGVQQLALARLRSEAPTSSERELRIRLAALWLPESLLDRVVAYAGVRVATL